MANKKGAPVRERLESAVSCRLAAAATAAAAGAATGGGAGAAGATATELEVGVDNKTGVGDVDLDGLGLLKQRLVDAELQSAFKIKHFVSIFRLIQSQ